MPYKILFRTEGLVKYSIEYYTVSVLSTSMYRNKKSMSSCSQFQWSSPFRITDYCILPPPCRITDYSAATDAWGVWL